MPIYSWLRSHVAIHATMKCMQRTRNSVVNFNIYKISFGDSVHRYAKKYIILYGLIMCVRCFFFDFAIYDRTITCDQKI